MIGGHCRASWGDFVRAKEMAAMLGHGAANVCQENLGMLVVKKRQTFGGKKPVSTSALPGSTAWGTSPETAA
jgi:hypothetical protein